MKKTMKIRVAVVRRWKQKLLATVIAFMSLMSILLVLDFHIKQLSSSSSGEMTTMSWLDQLPIISSSSTTTKKLPVRALGSYIYRTSTKQQELLKKQGHPNITYEDCQASQHSCPSAFANSTKFFSTPNPHGPNTMWMIEKDSIPEFLPVLLQETLQIRFQRVLGLDYHQIVQQLPQNITLAKVHQILKQEQFSLVFWDSRDMTDNDHLHRFVFEKIVPLIGWEYSFFLTRSTTMSSLRDMEKFKTLPWNTVFDETSLGGITDFHNVIGTMYRGVKHYTFYVRTDVKLALEEALRKLQIDPTVFVDENVQDPVVHYAGRTKDVTTFWSHRMYANSAKFRSIVSEVVFVTGRQYGFTTLTDIIGHRAKKGRTGVHPLYAKALLEFKIIVLAQRDLWEDHYRLMEALISGACVFSDPMRDFPRGVEETIVVYKSLEDLQEKLVYYLEHPEERMALASKARKVALTQHLEHHRWEALLLDDWSIVNDYGVSILD